MSTFDKSVVLSYQDSADSNYEEIKAGFEHDFTERSARHGLEEDIRKSLTRKAISPSWSRTGNTKRQSRALRKTKLRIRSIDVLKRTNGKWKIVRTINYPEA